MCEAAALCIVDRLEQALRLVQHSLDELPFLWRNEGNNVFLYTWKRVSRRIMTIMSWWFQCIQAVLLWYLVLFFGNIVFRTDSWWRRTQREEEWYPGCCRHTLSFPGWASTLVQMSWGPSQMQGVWVIHNTGSCSDIIILELRGPIEILKKCETWLGIPTS